MNSDISQPVSLYLAGKVPKGDDIGRVPDWRDEYAQALNILGKFAFISPEDPTLDESKPLEVFGHDCHQILEADIVIINASSKLGVGTAQEMVIAKHFSKPVLTVLPRDTHHRRSNLNMHGIVVADWVHPFIYSMSDRIFDDLLTLAEFLSTSEVEEVLRSAKTLDVITKAIGLYRSNNPERRV